MEYIYLHLLVSRARALVWNYPKERFTFDRMKEKERSVRFPHRGMKEQSRVPSSDSSIHAAVFLLERQLFIESDCSRSLMKASLISESMTLCACVCVFVCVCASVIASISMAMMSHSARHLPG